MITLIIGFHNVRAYHNAEIDSLPINIKQPLMPKRIQNGKLVRESKAFVPRTISIGNLNLTLIHCSR